jgi:dipeptidyl aminopeptidase/acylaminoacyl peptidase
MKNSFRIRFPVAIGLVWLASNASAAPASPATDAGASKNAAATSAAPASGTASTYSGHGASSVAPEVIAKFAPKPLPDDVARAIQSMLDVRAPGGGIVSSDGKRLFFTWNVTGTRQVWRLDGPEHFPVELTGGEDQTSLANIAPDGSYLIIQRDRKGEENPGLYLQNPEGGPLSLVQHLPQVQTEFQFVSNDSRYIYFRSNDLKPDAYALHRYDVKEKKSELLFSQDGLWSIADHRPDGKLLLGKEVGSNMVEYYEWSPGQKDPTPLFGQGEREDYQAAYGLTNGEVLVKTPHFGEFRRLYSWKAGKFTAISPEIKHDVTAFEIDDARKHIFYEVNEDGYNHLHVLDAKTHAEVKLPKLPPADHVFASTISHNGRYAVINIDPGNGPQLRWVLDWNTNKLTRWQLPSAPEVDLTRFVRATLESYPARDGTPIPMFVRRPAHCDGPCPVIVDFHGGPEGQAVPGFSPYAQIFVDAGFVFIEPNVRGSDGYGKTWIHADDGPKRLDVITDIEDCAKYVREKFAVNGKAPKVGILGGSYGGYSSLVGMTMFAGAYDAGVEIVGISNLVTFLQNTAPYRRALRISEYGDPEKDHDALIKLSPITYLDRVKGPMMLIQGASDPRVPVGEALQIHEALEAKKLPNDLVIFADEGHGAQKRDNVVYQIGYALKFFKQHLQASPTAQPAN